MRVKKLRKEEFFKQTKDKGDNEKKRIKLKRIWKTDESKNGWTNNRKNQKQHKMFFWSAKLNKESDQNGRCKKRDKKSRTKKKGKRKKKNKKEDTGNIFKKWDILQKSKVWKKRRYRNCKRDVKHNSKLEKHFIKYKFWRKEINKKMEKNKETFQNEGFFLMVQEGWKTQNWRCGRGQKIQKKRENKKTIGTRRKENGTRKTRVQKKKKKQKKKEKHKEKKWNKEKKKRKRL